MNIEKILAIIFLVLGLLVFIGSRYYHTSGKQESSKGMLYLALFFFVVSTVLSIADIGGSITVQDIISIFVVAIGLILTFYAADKSLGTWVTGMAVVLAFLGSMQIALGGQLNKKV